VIEVLYFAGLREALGCSRETVGLPEDVRTIGTLRDYLAARGDPWQNLATAKNLRAAVNHAMVGPSAGVKPGDEVAFFPPVTGG
jgi:molybdopterin synthase sulfur carrier subunit